MNATPRYWLTIIRERADRPDEGTIIADAHPSADRRGYTIRSGYNVDHATTFADATVIALAALPGQQLEAILDAAEQYLDEKCSHQWSRREARAGDPCERCEYEAHEEARAEAYMEAEADRRAEEAEYATPYPD